MGIEEQEAALKLEVAGILQNMEAADFGGFVESSCDECAAEIVSLFKATVGKVFYDTTPPLEG